MEIETASSHILHLSWKQQQMPTTSTTKTSSADFKWLHHWRPLTRQHGFQPLPEIVVRVHVIQRQNQVYQCPAAGDTRTTNKHPPSLQTKQLQH